MSEPLLKNIIDDAESDPPIFKTWKRLYAAVLFNLALLVVLFYFFGKAFQ
ncbi:MAG: hypothetical protein HY707_02405 [Ignavibacteriae bacterium]|nr:hypothetical protein [Ignavibacteriota bacterium]